MSTEKLKTAVLFIEAKSKSKSDSLLIQLSGLTSDELHLAYARRLMLDYRWEEAQSQFQKVSKKYRMDRLNGVNSTYGYGEKLSSFAAPKLWLKADRTSKIVDFDAYLAVLLKNKKAVDAATNVDHFAFADRLVDAALDQGSAVYGPWTAIGAARFIEDYLEPTVADSPASQRAIDGGLTQLTQLGLIGVAMTPALFTPRQLERLAVIRP